MLLFIDTETTGIPIWSSPSSGDDQPHIVQLAAAIVDDESNYEIKTAMNLIIRPDFWKIPEEATKTHGITTEQASMYGVDETLAVDLLLGMWGGHAVQVGHNVNFDRRIIRIALKRYYTPDIQEKWKDGEKYCTMFEAKKIMKGKKVPTLSKAFEFFMAEPLKNAHTAWGDLLGTLEIYKCLNSKS